MTDTISKQRAIIDSIHDDTDKARRNRNGLIQMNMFADRVRTGDIQYKRNTEKFCPIMLAAAVAVVTAARRFHHFQMMLWKKRSHYNRQRHILEHQRSGAVFRDINNLSSSAYRIIIIINDDSNAVKTSIQTIQGQQRQRQKEIEELQHSIKYDSLFGAEEDIDMVYNRFKGKSSAEIAAILTNEQFNYSTVEIHNNKVICRFYKDWHFRMGSHKTDGQRTQRTQSQQSVDDRKRKPAVEMRGKEERKIEAQFKRMMSSKPYAPYTIDELGEDFSGLRIGPPYPLLLPVLFVSEEDDDMKEAATRATRTKAVR